MIRFSVCTSLIAAALSASGLAQPAEPLNPTVQILPDGSAKHLISGYICPASLKAKADKSALICGRLIVFSAAPPDFSDSIAQTRRALIEGVVEPNGAFYAALPPTGAFPPELAIGGASYPVEELHTTMGNSDYKLAVATWRVETGASAIQIQASATVVDDPALDEMPAEIEGAKADWAAFAAANAAPPQPQPVDPAAVATFLVERKTERERPFLETASGSVRHKPSGFVCPVTRADGAYVLIGIGADAKQMACEYHTAYGRMGVAVRAVPMKPAKDCGPLPDEVPQVDRTIRIAGEDLKLEASFCPASRAGQRWLDDEFLASATGRDWSVYLMASVFQPGFLTAEERRAAEPYLILPAADRGAAFTYMDSIWSAVAAANAQPL